MGLVLFTQREKNTDIRLDGFDVIGSMIIFL
jgi:hypothetical protein